MRIALFLFQFSFLFYGIAHAEKGPPSIKVGITAPLTGPVAKYGVALKNGIELAMEKHSADLESVQFVFEDDRYDGKSAVSAFHKLRNIDKVDLVFTFGMVSSEAVAPLAEQHQMPLLANSINPDCAYEREYVVRFINHSAQYTEKLLDYYRENKLRRIAAVKTTSSYCDDLLSSMERQLSSEESLHLQASLGFDDADFRTVIARLRTGNFDVAFVCLFPGQINTFFRQASSLALKLPVTGTEVLDNPTEIAESEGAMEGVVFASNHVQSSFRAEYEERFGNADQISTAANGYDLAVLLSKLAQKLPNNPDGTMILKAVKASGGFSGASGIVEFKEDDVGGRFFDFPLVLRRVSGNGVVSLVVQ